MNTDSSTPQPTTEDSAPETPASQPTKETPRFNSKKRSKMDNNPSLYSSVKGGHRDEGGFRIKRQTIQARSTAPAYSGDEPVASASDETTIEEETTQGSKYVIDGALRRVPPYYFTYLTFCKMRWRDRNLLEVFSSEFRDKDRQYYKEAIEGGQVTINQKVANLETIVRNGDQISHRTHKHEPPVTSRKIKIVYEDDELVVIDKPSGIPVHPTGRYRFNTVVMVLKHEQDKNVHPCNRLDRLTSGLMFLAKSGKAADKMGAQLRDREVKKEYIARVKGEFPLGTIVVDEPLTTVAPKVALNRIKPDGKPAKTEFKRISYDGQTSIVRCRPYTGRTHQIRVHLQYLGHPIANDPIYSNEWVWGPELGKDGAGDDAELEARLSEIGRSRPASTWITPVDYAKFEEGRSKAKENGGFGEALLNEKCDVCRSDLYSDPGSNDLDLWLHALTYSSLDKSWSYETEFPEWALEPSRKFMKLAMEEAKKCEGTETAFSVGAVLVKDGEVLETGYSRELPGNTHAEQCALEKYFAKNGGVRDVPEGTVIFTTMEPCSERLSGNLPCVDRILGSIIKTVFVGVVEPDTFVANNTGRKKLADAGIEYIHIPGYEEECLAIATKKPKELDTHR